MTPGMGRRLVLRPALAVALVGVIAGPTPAVAEAAPAPADTAPTVALVGDSLPFQAFGELNDTLGADRKIALNVSGLGLNIRDVLPRTRSHVLGDRPADIFLAFIGTHQSNNDPPTRWRTELRTLLDLVSPRVDCIRVFDIDDTTSGYYALHDRQAVAFNRITRRLTDDHPNAEWYHFSAWADLAGPEYEKPDILHHNASGVLAIARLIRFVANTCDPAVTSGPFWDVPDTHPAAAAIAWVGETRLFPGYANHTYRAEIGGWVQSATRGDLTTMTWKLVGRPQGHPEHPWRDGGPTVDRVLRWVAAEGLLPGLADGTFRPSRPVSRAQAVHMLWRLSGRPTEPDPDPWRDVDGDPFRWAAAHRLLNGYSGGRFRPLADLTRAQLANLLFRFADLPAPPVPAPMPTPSEPPPPGAPSPTGPPLTTVPPTTAPPPTTSAPPPTTVVAAERGRGVVT